MKITFAHSIIVGEKEIVREIYVDDNHEPSKNDDAEQCLFRLIKTIIPGGQDEND